MAIEQDEHEEGVPWLSWGITGVLTLAAVLVFGLVVSARNPRSEAAATVASADSNPGQPVANGAGAAGSAAPASTAAPLSSAGPPSVAKPSDTASTTGALQSSPSASAPAAKPSTAPAVTQTVPAPAMPQALIANPQPEPSPASPPPAVATAPAKPAVPAVDSSKLAAYTQATSAARRAMAKRDLATSKRQLQSAASNAQSEAERAELDRLQIIQDHIEQFWTQIRKVVAAMEPTEEIVLSETNRVAVIEASRDELKVQMYGRPRAYRIEALPMELLTAIVNSSIKQTPDAKLIVGAFLAMDAQGDRARARKLWQDAIAAGDDEGKQLMPELDLPRTGQ